MCEKLPPYFYCTDVQNVRGSTEPGTLEDFPLQKLFLVHFSPTALSVFTQLMMMAVQWVVGVPNCKGDEVPLCFNVTQKSPQGSWIALGLLTEACVTFKCGFFQLEIIFVLFWECLC